MKYAFKSRHTAQTLSRPDGAMINAPMYVPADRVYGGTICVTPAQGIPAYSIGSGPGFADCEQYAIEEATNSLVFVQDTAGNNVLVRVYNIFQTDIAGDTRITAKRVFDKLIADAEDCPEDLSQGPVNP